MRFLSRLLVVLGLLISGEAWAQDTCTYFGGYPWRSKGCLTSTDLNAAIATALLPPTSLATGVAAANLGSATGDVIGTWNSTRVNALQGYPLANVPPTDGQILTWVGLNNRYEPTQPTPPSVSVPSNAVLKTKAIAAFPAGVWRQGFSAQGDSPAVVYSPSGSACSLNSGNGDDGSQVKSADNKCWLANLNGLRPTPKIWGAVGDGTNNDSAAVQAAINALQNGTLFTGPYNYKINTGLTSAGPIKIVGEHSNVLGGFVAGVTNLNMLTLSGGHSEVDGVRFDALTIGANTSGAAITLSTATTGTHVHDNLIDGAFVGVDMRGGVVNEVFANRILNVVTNGSAVRVGADTTASNTIDPHIHHNWFSGKAGGTTNYALTVLDAGGLQYHSNTVGILGSRIIPGANQAVVWGFFRDQLSDTNSGASGLTIDATAATSQVRGLTFVNGWTASAAQQCVSISNSGAGMVQGLQFIGHSAKTCQNNGFLLDGAGSNNAITDISIVGGEICGNSVAATNASNGVAVNGTGVKGKIIGATIGNSCGGVIGGGTQGTGIVFNAATSGLVIEGNDLRTSTGTGGALAGTGPTASALSSNNLGVLWTAFYAGTGGVSLANAATLPLPIGSGVVSFNNSGNGDAGVFAIGGGQVGLISSPGGTFVVSASPAAGKIGLSWNGSNYILTSAFGSTVTITATILRSRDAN